MKKKNYICKKNNQPMSSVNKTLSKRVTNGYANLYFRVNYSRALRFRINTNINVPIDYWNTTKETLKIPSAINLDVRDELRATKQQIELYEEKVLDLVRLFPDKAKKEWIEKVLPLVVGLSDEEMTTSNVLKEIDKSENPDKYKKLGFYDLAEIFLQEKKYSACRERSYRVLFRCAKRFEIFCLNVHKMNFEWDLTCTKRTDIELFFEYLENEHIYRNKYKKLFDKILVEYPREISPKHKTTTFSKRGDNYLVCMHKKIKCFWSWLIEKEYTTNNPFTGVEIGYEKYGTPYYISIEERNIIANYDFSNNPHLETQRDIFIFQCLIGCRVGDLYAFRKSNIVNNVLVYVPQKTKEESRSFTARVPLSDYALQLLEKYDGQDRRKRIFPFISQVKYNNAIKQIFTICNITRNVCVRNSKTGENEMKPLNEIASSHLARRTFIGNAYKFVKDPNIIGRMSGHVEGSKAFGRYRDIDDDILKDVVNAIQ